MQLFYIEKLFVPFMQSPDWCQHIFDSFFDFSTHHYFFANVLMSDILVIEDNNIIILISSVKCLLWNIFNAFEVFPLLVGKKREGE